jgi:hypothetical protein
MFSRLNSQVRCCPAEFEARDVELAGDVRFEVPDGHRLLVTAGPDGSPVPRLQKLEGPTWRWSCTMSQLNDLQLQLEELGGPDSGSIEAGGDASTAA